MKVAINIPVHGSPEMGFTRSLGRMLIHTARERPDLDIELFDYSALVSDARTELVKASLAWGADAQLWADIDHKFPPETLVRLLSHNLAVVGANHVKRKRPTFPVGTRMLPDSSLAPLWTTESKARASSVEEAATIGLGLCLVRREVYDALERRAAELAQESYWPLFAMEWGPDGKIKTCEDVFFFRKLRDAGVKIYADHGLSWAVKHIHRHPLSHADAIADNPESIKERRFEIRMG